jgi:cell division protease FtsH
MFFPGGSPELSNDLAALVDEETARLVNEAHERATTVLREHRAFLQQLSEILILTEVIDGPDLHAYFDGSKPIPSADDLRRELASNGQRSTAATGPDVVVQPPPPPRP